MTLAPDAAALLAQIGDARPRFETMTADEARANSRARRGVPTAEPPVATVGDRDIPGPAGPIRVRHYRPTTSPEGSPAIVFLHGGGWVIGDLDSHDAICRRIAVATGCDVVAVDYRLAPDHRCPAAADDGDAALRWLIDHAAELGVDPERVAIAGDSAGANLAAVIARRHRDRGGRPLRAQVLIYPLTDSSMSAPSWTEHADGPFVSAASMAWFWEQYAGDGDRLHPDASPLHADDLAGLPPALVITAEHDVLRDEGERYGEALRAASVPTEIARFDGVFHGFFGFVGELDAARRANALVADFLRRTVLPAAGATVTTSPTG